MRSRLTTSNGDTLWHGDLDIEEDVAELRRMLTENRNRVARKERDAMRVAVGLCARCGIRPLATEVRCAPCAQDHNESESERQRLKRT